MHQSIFLRLQKEASTSPFLTGLPSLPVASCRPWDAFLVKHSVLGFKQVFGHLRVSQWQTDFVSPTLQQILMRTEARVKVCCCQPLGLQEHSGGTAAAVQGPGSLESVWPCGVGSVEFSQPPGKEKRLSLLRWSCGRTEAFRAELKLSNSLGQFRHAYLTLGWNGDFYSLGIFQWLIYLPDKILIMLIKYGFWRGQKPDLVGKVEALTLKRKC